MYVRMAPSVRAGKIRDTEMLYWASRAARKLERKLVLRGMLDRAKQAWLLGMIRYSS